MHTMLIPHLIIISELAPTGDGILAVFRDWKNGSGGDNESPGGVRDQVTRLKSQLNAKLPKENRTTLR